MTLPLSIWVVSDGRTGMENQALGLAEAVQRLEPAEITIKRIRWRGLFDKLPSALKTGAMLHPSADSAAPAPGEAWPDLWIATGRATLPLSARVRRRSGGKTLVVQTQDPRWKRDAYGLVIAPAHDAVAGPNVLSITGSPHRVTPERLAEGAAGFEAALSALPRPRVAILIGGRSAAFDLTGAHAAELAMSAGDAVEAAGGSAMVTYSRRTPTDAREVFTLEMSVNPDFPRFIWDGTGPNPYFAFLHYADHILVTEDSANMAAEAASTGKPVHILPMLPLKPPGKFARLHADLKQRGAARPFDGTLDRWDYEPLAETERAAKAVLAKLGR
ncbi:MAG TPA: mitochondrial fission ELM1 family protein [Brevundimonas sp.]|nr:mitochondrial fission ELM1 family protein [Brevundimonas sp.]